MESLKCWSNLNFYYSILLTHMIILKMNLLIICVILFHFISQKVPFVMTFSLSSIYFLNFLSVSMFVCVFFSRHFSSFIQLDWPWDGHFIIKWIIRVLEVKSVSLLLYLLLLFAVHCTWWPLMLPVYFHVCIMLFECTLSLSLSLSVYIYILYFLLFERHNSKKKNSWVEVLRVELATCLFLYFIRAILWSVSVYAGSLFSLSLSLSLSGLSIPLILLIECLFPAKGILTHSQCVHPQLALCLFCVPFDQRKRRETFAFIRISLCFAFLSLSLTPENQLLLWSFSCTPVCVCVRLQRIKSLHPLRFTAVLFECHWQKVVYFHVTYTHTLVLSLTLLA